MAKTSPETRGDLPTVRFARNPSYANSLRLAFANALLYAPLTLWLFTRTGLFGLVRGLASLTFGIVLWVFSRLMVLVMGLAGFVVSTKVSKE